MIKDGVKINGVKPEIVLALLVIQPIFRRFGYDMVITEVTGAKHSRGSLHYVGLAADLRSKHLSNEHKNLILIQAQAALGPEFDIILEARNQDNEHYHLEYQPK